MLELDKAFRETKEKLKHMIQNEQDLKEEIAAIRKQNNDQSLKLEAELQSYRDASNHAEEAFGGLTVSLKKANKQIQTYDEKLKR